VNGDRSIALGDEAVDGDGALRTDAVGGQQQSQAS